MAMLIAGFLLRIFNLEVTGLWMDEIHSANGTDPDNSLAEVIEYCKRDQPPVFFVMLHYWYKLFSFNDFSGRLFVVLTGCAGIISMFFVGREFKNDMVGLAASFITTINYFHVDFSRQIRFYPLVFLLASLSFLFFLRIFKRRRVVDFVLYSVSTAALLNTHYFGMVVFASQFILFVYIIFWKRISDWRFITASLLSGVIAGLSFLHWLPVIQSDLQIPEFHVQQIPWYFPALYYWVYFRDVVTCVIFAAMIFLALRGIYSRWKGKSSSIEDVILLGWVGLGFLIPLIYSLLRMPMMEYKYTFIVVPGIFIFVALGFEAITRASLKPILAAVLLASFLINSIFVNSIYFRKPFEAWREVTEEIKKTGHLNEVAFTEYAWYFRYYFKVLDVRTHPYEPAFADFKGLTDQFNAVWVLRQTRYPDRGLLPEQETYLKEHFRLEKELTFIDANAKYYVRR
jgi:uncharacterized membrane protein